MEALQDMNCPYCGAPLEPDTMQGSVVTCPYCANTFVPKEAANLFSPRSKKKEEKAEKQSSNHIRFYKPRLDEQDFERRCQRLLDEDPLLPDDIFVHIRFKEVNRLYLPTWTMQGAMTGRSRWTIDGKEKMKSEVEYPFHVRVLANDSQALPASIKEQLTYFPFLTDDEPGTSDRDTFGRYAASIGFEIDESRADQAERGKEVASRLTKKEIIPKYRSTPHLKPVSELDCNLVELNEEVCFVPFYQVLFYYKDIPYFIVADAISGEAIAYTLPEDRARKEVLEKDYSTSGCGCGCLLMCIPPLLYFGLNAIDGIPCFLLSILALGLTGIIIHLLDRKHKKKKETLVAQALKRRQQLK